MLVIVIYHVRKEINARTRLDNIHVISIGFVYMPSPTSSPIPNAISIIIWCNQTKPTKSIQFACVMMARRPGLSFAGARTAYNRFKKNNSFDDRMKIENRLKCAST